MYECMCVQLFVFQFVDCIRIFFTEMYTVCSYVDVYARDIANAIAAADTDKQHAFKADNLYTNNCKYQKLCV